MKYLTTVSHQAESLQHEFQCVQIELHKQFLPYTSCILCQIDEVIMSKNDSQKFQYHTIQ
jgi:hypothetical protein